VQNSTAVGSGMVNRYSSSLAPKGSLARTVLEISRRLGRSDPTVTLRTCAHLFDKTDTTIATAIDAALETKDQR
jgi:hypothetical protein